MNGHIGIQGERVDKIGDKLVQFADINKLKLLNHFIDKEKVT